MLASIWEDVKKEFGYGNMVTRIIIINVALFVFLNVMKLALRIGNEWDIPDFYFHFRNFFCVGQDWFHNLTHPWVFITSGFLHEGLWHIFWNMILLYWFGRIVGDFVGNHRVLPIYVLGAIVGAVAFFVSANLIPYIPEGAIEHTKFALGASAGVMAMALAAATISPDYNMRLLFLGDVKLKYIVGVLLLIDLVGLGGNHNTGGHFAHLGGALFGYLFVRQLQNGVDWSESFNGFFNKIKGLFGGDGDQSERNAPRKRKRTSVFSNVGRSTKGSQATDTDAMGFQEKLDTILEKIKQKGYDSLTDAEKAFLNNASKK